MQGDTGRGTGLRGTSTLIQTPRRGPLIPIPCGLQGVPAPGPLPSTFSSKVLPVDQAHPRRARAGSDPREGVATGPSAPHAASSWWPTVVSHSAYLLHEPSAPSPVELPLPGAVSLPTGLPEKQDTAQHRDSKKGTVLTASFRVGSFATRGMLSKIR